MNPDSQPINDWFDEPSQSVTPEEDPIEVAPSVREAGDPARSTFTGAIAGLFGGLAWLAIAVYLGDPEAFTERVRLALGQSAHGDPTGSRLWIALAAFFGVLLGGVLGRLTRRLFPLVPRVLFGAILLPSLWTFLYAFVILRFMPTLAQVVPFAPSGLGALGFGVCIALARPSRPHRRSTRSKEELYAEPMPASEPASFPLVHRRRVARV